MTDQDASQPPVASPPDPTTIQLALPPLVRPALLELLASKKLMLALFAIAAWLTAKLGAGFDPATALAMVSPILAAILGQGVADAGKGKAIEEARLSERRAWHDHARRMAVAYAVHADDSARMAGIASMIPPPITPPDALGANHAPAIVGLILLAGLGAFGAVTHGCAGSSGPTTGKPATTTTGKFLQCAEQDLTQIVTNPDGSGTSILGTVANDLVRGDYVAAIEALIGRIGNDAVGCAVLAISTVATTGKLTTDMPTPIQAHARELIDAHKWVAAPATVRKQLPPAAPAAGSGSDSAAVAP